MLRFIWIISIFYAFLSSVGCVIAREETNFLFLEKARTTGGLVIQNVPANEVHETFASAFDVFELEESLRLLTQVEEIPGRLTSLPGATLGSEPPWRCETANIR